MSSTNPTPPAIPSPSQHASIQTINQAVQQTSAWVEPVRREIGRVIVGQQHLIDRLLVGLLANGHVLLEGVPGLAKTLALKTLAATIRLSFKRIQFTPDMLPADIIGTEIYNPRDLTFAIKHGPVFANLILADEINRAPAKVQSALLEAMQEHQVTIGDTTHALPEPFLVLATQNPIEQEGTYSLPEAQVDRFMLKVIVTYPTPAEERVIIDLMGTTDAKPQANAMLSVDDILKSRQVVNTIYIDDKVKDYIVSLIHATREPARYQLDLQSHIQYAASPRASISLTLASRALAFLNGRGYVTPQDIKSIAPDVLRHRVAVTYEAEAEGLNSENIIQKILDAVPVP
ncbi:MAG: MoxR family ATPase [Verrucomicrobiales bacterium]|jgi:MoxR-like ATPase|nr:MoxR family ATPase [Verrucomicrobiales bacterium]